MKQAGFGQITSDIRADVFWSALFPGIGGYLRAISRAFHLTVDSQMLPVLVIPPVREGLLEAMHASAECCAKFRISSEPSKFMQWMHHFRLDARRSRDEKYPHGVFGTYLPADQGGCCICSDPCAGIFIAIRCAFPR
ncbi:hypothetical protein [Leisingera aquimarina]|uniref:hypothetical protein n=1 Tax=Leisingera aquimarina TaxID=476529 RepID=UPI0012EBBA8A|nr:hypothetical protein [Leisingera aquimarina]